MAYKKQLGFTIVELMISIAVFSVAITMVTAGVIQIGRYYQHGVTKAKLANLSRKIQSNVSQSYQYNGADPLPTGDLEIGVNTYKGWCIGTTRYLYIIGTNEFFIENITSRSCTDTSISSTAQRPLPKDSVVTKFDILQSGLLINFKTRFVIGAKDLFESDNYDLKCRPNAGREFCTVVEFESDVVRKVY